jgi:hypothetical protein
MTPSSRSRRLLSDAVMVESGLPAAMAFLDLPFLEPALKVAAVVPDMAADLGPSRSLADVPPPTDRRQRYVQLLGDVLVLQSALVVLHLAPPDTAHAAVSVASIPAGVRQTAHLYRVFC